MAFLKRVITVIIIFSLLIVIVSLFLPSKSEVSKNVFISADIHAIKNYLEEQSQIKSLFNFSDFETNFEYDVSDVENGVDVIFSLQLDYGFNPIIKFFGLFSHDNWIEQIDAELIRIKTEVEELPKIHKVNVQIKAIDKPIWFLSIRDTVAQKDMNNIHGKSYEKINNYIDSANLEKIMSPITIYHSWSDTIVDIEIGIPISKETVVFNNKIKLNNIDAGTYVTATHYGAYDRLPETYFGINEWMRKNKVTVIGAPWEMYVTDPAKETNPQKWETTISFPIEKIKEQK
ncbi:MAG TPA: GyrI-like domain-containing protein [Vicingaceae bacterium]